MRKFTLMVVGGFLTLLWAATGLANPTSQSDVTAGRALFFNNGYPKVALLDSAQAQFQNAVNADSTDQQAHFFLAATEGMSLIAKQGSGGINTLRDMVQALGGNWTGVSSLLAMKSGAMPFSPTNYSAATPRPIPCPAAPTCRPFWPALPMRSPLPPPSWTRLTPISPP